MATTRHKKSTSLRSRFSGGYSRCPSLTSLTDPFVFFVASLGLSSSVHRPLSTVH